MLPEGAEGQGEAPLPSPETYLKGQSREVRGWGSPPPCTVKDPRLHMPSSWMRELRSRDRGPSLPAAFAFWREFPENNLEPELGNPIPVLWARLATRTSCPAPAYKDVSLALPEIHRKPPIKNLEPGE